MTNLNEWEEIDKTITTEELDDLVKAMYDSELLYKQAKEISTDLYNRYTTSKTKLIAHLKAAGKTKYHVDGVGVCTVTSKLKVVTPKTMEEKELFFNWLEETQGEVAALIYKTINYASLNKLYNETYEESDHKSEFKIPGISTPTEEIGLQFRKK